MSRFIHQLPDWPAFRWSAERLEKRLAAARHRQGRLIGRMEAQGFSLREDAVLQTITEDVLKSSEIEGEILDRKHVRSSIARRLGIVAAGPSQPDRNVEGVVEMTLDATQRFEQPLSAERLFGWHAALFSTGRSGIRKIVVGAWRDGSAGAMRVVSGPIGRERVHYVAPPASRVGDEMAAFLHWMNEDDVLDPVLKAALAHLWFVTIHPFEDGNGRVARAIADLSLARSERSAQRFYSMSAQIRLERKAYYDALEKVQKGTLDVTSWLEWFLACLDRSFGRAEEILAAVLSTQRFWQAHGHAELNARQRMIVNRLLDNFEGKLTSSKWASITNCSQDTALRDIDDLIRRGLLMKDSAGGRSTSYLLIRET